MAAEVERELCSNFLMKKTTQKKEEKEKKKSCFVFFPSVEVAKIFAAKSLGHLQKKKK